MTRSLGRWTPPAHRTCFARRAQRLAQQSGAGDRARILLGSPDCNVNPRAATPRSSLLATAAAESGTAVKPANTRSESRGRPG